MSEDIELLPFNPPKQLFEYTGEIMHVYAKNLIAVNIDLGFATWRRVPIKLRYIFVPKENGQKFKEFLTNEFSTNKKVLIRGYGYHNDHYEADLYSQNEFKTRFYNNMLLESGIAIIEPDVKN